MRCKRLPCISIMMNIFEYRRSIQSAVHKYAACIARKYSSCTCLILGVILVFYIGRSIAYILKTRSPLVPEQYVVDYIAANLKVMVKAGDNETTARLVQITLSNTGHENITFGQWRIYFYSIIMNALNKTAGFQVGHLNGGLFFLSPIKNEFQGISVGSSLDLTLEQWSVARTDHFQNWYVASEAYGLSTPKIIENTGDVTLSFVRPYENAFQWKKFAFDAYNPYTPEERYIMNKAFKEAPAKDSIQVIPKPFSAKTVPYKTIVFDKTWVVVKQKPTSSAQVPTVSHLLAINLGLKEATQETRKGKYIKFKTDESFSKEQYELRVDSSSKSVLITSSNGEGAFYGVQTLISILESSNTISEMVIKDHPRFSYRGLMIDVARTFQKKETIKKLIDIMSRYKLNKLHMHLTDNDGWRIEIPSIPELTKYGSRRCHYFETDKCLIPNLGSGPYSETQGSGFYTVSDFREILQYAKERYVEVIPEIDVPGHAFAAIKAMQYREQDLQRFKGHENRPSYILSDDVSGIRAIQWWLGSSINPCLNSTYSFLEAVLTDLQVIYEGIQKLELVHIGGDEVPDGVWEKSSVCQSLYSNQRVDHNTIKKNFLVTIANIAYKHGLKISVWEDGIHDTKQGPYDVKDFKQNEVFVNAWNNVWELRTGGRAIEFADVGYKVILSMATHLYFDHSYEPDPEERGLYWASRFIDTYTVFGFMPMDIFANADFDTAGNKLDLNDTCGGPCPQTKAPNNYVGMEACVWSETIQNESQLFNMIFPRLLAFSERAWHAAEWEALKTPEERKNATRRDFKRFVNIVGKKELSRLEHAGVQYRIPPPGFSFSNDTRVAKFNTFYSGHKVMMSLGNDSSWRSVGTEIQIPKGVSDIHAYAVSPVLKRKSRTVSLHIA